jgi:hypothetical protein
MCDDYNIVNEFIIFELARSKTKPIKTTIGKLEEGAIKMNLLNVRIRLTTLIQRLLL